jgi:hypothetical protein
MSPIIYACFWCVWGYWTATLYLRAQIISEFVLDQYPAKKQGSLSLTYQEAFSLCLYPVVTILWFTWNVLHFFVLKEGIVPF